MNFYISLRLKNRKLVKMLAGSPSVWFKFKSRLIIMEINNIGNNAGLVWNALNANGRMTETKLKKETGLASAEFFAALGWLAREGKLNIEVEVKGAKSCEYYSLNA